jgi:plastocyanin
MVRRAALVAAMLMLVSTASVSAASSHQVGIVNFAFSPTALKVRLGDTVNWHNGTTATTHTTTADLFNLWNQTVLHGATSVDIAFQEAGTFAYHCNIHTFMHGTVKVKMSATPSAGPASTTFLIRVATINAPAGFTMDIQKRKAGGAFATWQSTTGQTVPFVPPGTGTFQFRSRLRRLSDGTATGWSPTLSVKVN